MTGANESVPAAISAYIDATNAADTEAFISTFTADATLNDYGRGFTGRDGIRQWNGTDNIGVQAHFELHGVRPGSTPDTWIASVTVTGNGYNGDGDIEFRLRGDHIVSVRMGA